MPRQKQPIALQELAFDSLVGYIVDYCDSLSIKSLSTELHQAVAVLKHHVRDHVPRILFAEFCRQFLDKFYAIGCGRLEERPTSHQKAALEMVMDVEMVGLTLAGNIVRYMDPRDAHRIKGLRKLELAPGHPSMTRSLNNYHLQDLTTFIYPEICTDLDLEIIGPRCLKLEVLDIHGTGGVTDRGLRALRPCSELRIIKFYHCFAVTNDGMDELLNFHTKLEQFNVHDCFTGVEKTFDVLSRPISMVCPSVKRFTLIINEQSDVKSFTLESGHVTNSHLDSVVRLFPNLTYLAIYSRFTGDLRILRDLKSLAELKIAMFPDGYTMENLKELLTSIGANISLLNIDSLVGGTTQNYLNFIHEVCINVEVLSVRYLPKLKEEKLIVPSFQKLKHLDCFALPRLCARLSGFRMELDFCKMLSLESLRFQGFANTFQLIESMMLDNVKFPNLKDVRTLFRASEQSDRIINIARNNNLDFTIRSSY